jgi:alpha-L-rhamnosidase
MEWKAKWIWDSAEKNPRNSWVCFRKSFEVDETLEDAGLSLTADSRYVVYINGIMIGRGPVRGWPWEYYYDTYEIKDYLVEGSNTIAVLVTHYGVSNFQYIEGQAGFLGQIELNYGDRKEYIGTDNTWKTQIHHGYKRNSMRISCMQPWAEIYDARSFSSNWAAAEYCHSNWTYALELVDNGELPWKKLKPRDIPFLREEVVYPLRVQDLKEVKRKGCQVSFDLQPNFFKEERDSNPKGFLGYIATFIHVEKDVAGKICFPWSQWFSPYGDFKINGKQYSLEAGKREYNIELHKGENLFLMDVSTTAHGFFVHFNLKLEEQVKFTAPLYPEYEFVTIGPFEKMTKITIGEPTDTQLNMNNKEYTKLCSVSSVEELKEFSSWVKPVLPEHTCKDNVYTDVIYKDVAYKSSVSYDFQNMIIPNPEYTLIKDSKNDIEITIDFGKEITGFVEFDLEAAGGTIVDFYGVECIRKDGTIEHTENVHCTMRYVSRAGRQTYNSVIRRGFRYLVVTFRNITEPIKVYNIAAKLSTYPVAKIGSFESPDWELNKIWEISQYTTQLCMEDTYVDCPTYEQTYWVGDSRNEALINYYTFGAYGISRRCFNLVGTSLDRSPLPESQVPSGWQNVLTAWSLFWMSACREYYDYTGDMEFIEEIYPALHKSAEAFIKKVNDLGLLELQAWNMLDWAPMDTPEKGIITHQNAELVKALRDTAYVARLLHKEQEAEEMENWAKAVKEAINVHLWDEERQGYIDCIHDDGKKSKVISMQTNVMVYLCECSEGDRNEKIQKYLLDTPADFVKIGSPFMSFFYFEALTKVKSTEEMLKHIRKEWGGMIKEGASTCWETFPGFEKDRLSRSHCHAWSAAPGYFLGAYVLGVRPLSPGFKRVLIDPDLCDLEWASGSIPVPQGRIDIYCEKVMDKVRVKINGPEDIEYVLAEGIEIMG